MAEPTVNPSINPSTQAASVLSATTKKAEETMRDTAEKAQTAFTEFSDRTKIAAEKGQKMFEDAAEFQKGNLEAFVASGRVAAKGFEELARTSVDATRRNIEKANENLRTLAAAKSPTEFFQLQSELAKTVLDQAVSEFAKSSEAYVKLMGDITQPISNRYSVAMEKVKTTIAA